MADQTFELYKLMVEEVRDARRARRELSNMFMTLNVAGVARSGFSRAATATWTRPSLPGALLRWR